MADIDVLRALREQIVPPPLDLLRETARRRTQRNTRVGVATAAAAVAVMTATAFVVIGDPDRSQVPVGPSEPTSRPLTYAEGAVIHYGDQTFEAAGPVVELDLTDQGVAYRTDDNRIWFSDGTEVDEIGDVGDPGPGYGDDAWPLLVHVGWVVTGHTGSRVAWFEFPEPGGDPVAVVYDSTSHEELAREPTTVGPAGLELPYLVSDRYFYWFADGDSEREASETAQVRLDPETGEQVTVSEKEVQDDLRSQGPARTVMVGVDEEGAGALRITDGTDRNFASAGGRITPQGAQPLIAEDGGTGKQLAFDAPAGYPKNIRIWLTQWVDDDTVVLVSQLPRRDDVLECHIGSGACEVVLSGASSLVFPEVG
jgi:hypothetical protein